MQYDDDDGDTGQYSGHESDADNSEDEDDDDDAALMEIIEQHNKLRGLCVL
jgi:hypothetical protein